MLTGRSRAPRAPPRPRGCRRRARRPQRRSLLLAKVPDAVERVAELVGEPRADLVARPEQPAEVLHPLEVGDRDAAGVREHVREHGDAALGEDLVGLDRRRAVRALGDQPRLDARARSRPSPGPRARRARGCRTGSSSSSAFVTCSASGKSASDPCSATHCVQRRDVEPVRRRGSPPETSETAITDRAPVVRAPCAAIPPTLPKPWTTQRWPRELPAEPLRRRARSPSRRRRRSPRGGRREPPSAIGLPVTISGHRVPALHRVRVHHPGHRLLVRRHVRRGDVLLRADERRAART